MLHSSKNHIIFVSVFHRILDFKAGLDFYLGPFFIFILYVFIEKPSFPSLLVFIFSSASR